jgi:NAD(P)H-flavin reductase
VATGSGIVPIYSMINDLLINQHETRQIRLHWGLRDEANMFWFDNFERLMGEYPNFVFDPVLSRPGEEWSLCSGHVQDCLKRDFALGIDGWSGYVCGSPTMVEEVSQVLSELGMDAADIHHEKFV